MKKIRSVVPLCLAVSLGAFVASCGSFSSGPGSGGSSGGSGSPGIAGSGGSTGIAGSDGTPGSGGSTGIAGSDGSPGLAGSDGTPGSGGSTGIAGSDGSGGSGGSTGIAGSGGSTGIAGSGGSTGIAGSGGSTGIAGSGGSTGIAGSGGSTGIAGSGGSTASGGPCDVLAAAGNTCVAAHSTVRALYASYTGSLYQVCKGSSAAGPKSCPSGTTKDIGIVAGGYADSTAQDMFCAGSTCTVSIIYDQSPNGNHLHPGPAGGAKNTLDNPANATDLKTMINGHTVYGIFIKPGMGYRAGCSACTVVTPKGTATGDQPETEYMVTSQNGLVDKCCFDYGNAETDSHDDGNGTMEAVYFGGGVVWGTGSPGGHDNGPWVMADLENGLYAGWQNGQDQNISTNTPLKFPFVTAMVVGDSCSGKSGCAGSGSAYPNGRFALYGGDATAGGLTTLYDSIRPAKTGYVPMHKQGSIILGIGGDNSGQDGGQWFEGVMASGAASLATLKAVQANIVAAKYGK